MPQRETSAQEALPAGKNRAIRFVVIFAFLEILFYLVWMSPLIEESVLPVYVHALAVSSASMLGVFGESVRAYGASVVGPEFSIAITRGCDGAEALALFGAAVLASPVRVRGKVWGILLGSILLAAINLLRLMTLYCSGMHAPAIFEPLHLVVWPAVIVFASVALWILWVGVETGYVRVQ